MFLLNGTPISPDRAFKDADGTQYPANWIRLATAEEREAIGITEVPDPVRPDERFFWVSQNADGTFTATPKELEDIPAVDENGDPVFEKVFDPELEEMVDTDVQVITRGLKSVFIDQVKATAGSLLAPTDWKIVRAAEGIKDVDQATLDYRAAVRQASDAHEAAIRAVKSVQELASLNLDWPKP